MFPYYTETRANQFVAQRNRNASYAAVLGYNNLKKFEKGIHSTNEFELQKLLLLLPLYISSLSSASESYKGKIITKPGRLKEEEEEVKRNSDIERETRVFSLLFGRKNSSTRPAHHFSFSFLFFASFMF
jgi:hypothetical protein